MPLPDKKRITMNDVARVAKVSRPTASLVLTGKYGTARIPEETRERVLEAARELGYRRNALVEAMKTGRSYTLGFLMMGNSSGHAMLNFMGALDAAEENGYTVKRFRLYEIPEDKDTINRCLEERLDGLVVTYESMQLPLDVIENQFDIPHMPIVRIAPRKMASCGLEVRSDDENGIREAVHHLVKLGHKAIVFLGGIEGVGTGIPRLAGFERGIREAGVPTAYVRWMQWYSKNVPPILEELLAQQIRPTAIICGSDSVAMGTIQLLWRMGVRVPDDISVVGCGDLPLVNFALPPLTTVSIPYANIGREAVTRLLTILESPDQIVPDEEVLLPTPLIIRESTQSPPTSS